MNKSLLRVEMRRETLLLNGFGGKGLVIGSDCAVFEQGTMDDFTLVNNYFPLEQRR
jgi:hypothetical protein